MTIELELEDVLELVEAARAHGAAVFVTRDEDGDRVWLKVNSRKPGRPRKRAGAAPADGIGADLAISALVSKDPLFKGER